jgi:hypothetical protein
VSDPSFNHVGTPMKSSTQKQSRGIKMKPKLKSSGCNDTRLKDEPTSTSTFSVFACTLAGFWGSSRPSECFCALPGPSPPRPLLSLHVRTVRSHAIKCPSLPMHLAGGKRVQNALMRPGVLKGFLGNEGARWGVGAHRSHCVRNRHA